MKRIISYFGFSLTLLACVFSFCACSSDDDESTSADITLAYGTWVCTSSTDSNGSDYLKDLFVGETLTINSDKTYTSSSSSFGKKGTWSINGNTFIAMATTGKSVSATFSVNSTTLKLSGEASNGYSFNYTFAKK